MRLPKSSVAVIENPFYSIMNEPNSTLKRLQRTIAKLDQLNEQSAAGKLDLIIQLPYAVKSEQRKEIANQRRKELTEQLEGSRYGVAWADGTERIIQLNRSLENNGTVLPGQMVQKESFSSIVHLRTIFGIR